MKHLGKIAFALFCAWAFVYIVFLITNGPFHIVLMVLAILTGIAVGLWIYFVPTIIAQKRGHRNAAGIFALNLFFGWSLLGWVGALIWAVIQAPDVANGLNSPAVSRS